MKADFEACDPITFNLETCVKVRVKKARAPVLQPGASPE
jgi:hypothetical protein